MTGLSFRTPDASRGEFLRTAPHIKPGRTVLPGHAYWRIEAATESTLGQVTDPAMEKQSVLKKQEPRSRAAGRLQV